MITAIEMIDRNVFQLDVFYTADVECDCPVAFRISPFCIGTHTANLAKFVMDNMLVEGVITYIFASSQEGKLSGGEK